MAFGSVLRSFILFIVMALFMGCSSEIDPNAPLEPLGDFRLGHTVIVTKNAKLFPPSRRADLAVWKTMMIADIDKRLGRYDGEKQYHIGVHIDSYVLAIPGLPLVATPKSVLVVSLSVFDNATRQRLTEKPHQLNVFERSKKTTFIIGSGIANSKTEQMQNLSRNMARLIAKYLQQNKQWFGVAQDTETAPQAAIEAKTDN